MYFIVRDTATGDVLERRIGPSIPTGFPAGREGVEITEAEYGEMATKGLRYRDGGPLRWSHDGTTLTEEPDDRFVVEFSPASYEPDATGNGQETITVSVFQSDGTTPLSGFNATRFVRTSDGRRLRLAFSGGVATFDIPRSLGGLEDEIRSTDEFRIATGGGAFRVSIPLDGF